MARPVLALAAVCALLAAPAAAANIKKTYSYFDIAGRTVPEIERQLEQRGPRVSTTGQRHPGATRMEFKTQLKYGNKNGRCTITHVSVNVSTKVILPRWRQRGAAQDVRLIWETLEADIKRHEEQHVAIAERYGRELDAALRAIRGDRNCDQTARRANEITDRILRRHDQEQEKFDRSEARGFEKRFMRALERRLASTR